MVVKIILSVIGSGVDPTQLEVIGDPWHLLVQNYSEEIGRKEQCMQLLVTVVAGVMFPL